MAEATSRPATSDWGTPDPRDGAAYPATATWPQWGWQFLRRRRDYRRRYEQLIGGHGHRETCEIEDGRATHWRSPVEVLRHEYGIYPSSQNSTLDPCLDERPLFEGLEVITEVEVEGDAPVNLPKVLLEFDVALPVEPQLAAAKRLLLQRTKKLPRPQLQIAKFPTYLRLLDFDELGATQKEIGQTLFPYVSGERLRTLIRDTLTAARNRQNDYLIIAHKSSSPSSSNP